MTQTISKRLISHRVRSGGQRGKGGKLKGARGAGGKGGKGDKGAKGDKWPKGDRGAAAGTDNGADKQIMLTLLETQQKALLRTTEQPSLDDSIAVAKKLNAFAHGIYGEEINWLRGEVSSATKNSRVSLTGDQLVAVKRAGYTFQDLADPAFFEDEAHHCEVAMKVLEGRDRLMFKQAIRQFKPGTTG
jgi:hypothetical protein